MLVRPGRLLPSVIVGALVTGALALGAGTASGAEICEVEGQKFTVEAPFTVDDEGNCRDVLGVVPALSVVRELLKAVVPPPTTMTSAPPTSSTSPTPTATTTPRTSASQQNAQSQADQLAARQRAQQEAAARDAAAAAQRAAQAQAAAPANLLAPGAVGGAGLLAGVPALNFGAPNLALLAPAGSPLRVMAAEDAGARVTTTSDVQAMALDSVPAGLGTPAVVGTLILSALAAFALRHRVLHRARRAAEADTVETPVRASVS